MAFVAASILPFSSCSDFLDREPITKPEAGNFLTGAIQVENYINGLYMTLPSFSKFGLGVRSEEKNSDNIIAEKYDARLHGQNNQFSGASDWQTGYQNLRKVNYFFHNYKVPEAQENEDVLSLKGEAYFLRAYWHFDLLKKFGSIPVMDAFWDENATIAGLQIPAKTRNEVARFILSDLVEAKNLLHSRGKYSGIRINKEAAMVLAMNVALYEGTWEKYHSSDDFASSTNESNYFLGEVINWGNELFGCGIDLYKTGQNPGDAFAALFNSKDLSGMGEVLLWRKYSSDEGVFHDVNGNLKAGVVDSEGAAGITQSLVDNYLNADGTFIDPTNEKFKDFKETFEGRDPRLIQTVMNEGYRRRPPAGTYRTCPRRQAYAAVLHHYQRYGASHYLPYGLPNDHSGEEPESLFQNLRAGQPLLCRPAGMRMRPEMQEYHEAQRTGTRPRRLLQSRCRRHARRTESRQERAVRQTLYP